MFVSLITDRLKHIFVDENQRIVFWNDGNQEFEDSLDMRADTPRSGDMPGGEHCGDT